MEALKVSTLDLSRGVNISAIIFFHIFLPQNKITKKNADEVVKQAKQLTNVAKNELSTADIVFVADIIDGVLNAGSINSVRWRY